MKNLLNFSSQKLPSIIKDPFQINHIKSIDVSFSENLFDDNWKGRGTVYFTNGDTKGQQKFEGQSFDDVVEQIKQFLKELS